MRRTISFSAAAFDDLWQAVAYDGREGAAFLRCRMSSSAHEGRLLARRVERVEPEEYLVREPHRLSIASTAYARAAKKAALAGESLLFVHSHPAGAVDFSEQDNAEEPKLMEFLRARLGEEAVVGSLVLTEAQTVRGREWTGDGWRGLDMARILGQRIVLIPGQDLADEIPSFYDRQVLALGPELQRLLKFVHVGVVGVGGTGSAVVEQLVRLGIGTVTVFDGDKLAASNVSRVYGSSTQFEGDAKTLVQRRHIDFIGLGTRVHCAGDIRDEEEARKLRDCDIVFSCVDRQTPRAILNRLMLAYLIPVIDLGVKVDSEQGRLKGVFGRVTTLVPGAACLFCRQRITPAGVTAESLPDEERTALAEEGYAPELDTDAPAVVAFTTAVASQAVMELLHRLTGFMGEDRRSSEVVQLFTETRYLRTAQNPEVDCECGDRESWGRGDGGPFLGLMW